MRGDWDLIPGGRAEWIVYGIALIIVILAGTAVMEQMTFSFSSRSCFFGI